MVANIILIIRIILIPKNKNGTYNGPKGDGGEPLKLFLEAYGDFNFHYIFIINKIIFYIHP
jgi:hypothetical protein